MRALIIILLNIFSFCAIAQMSVDEQIDSLEQVVSRIRTELNKKEGELSEVVNQLKAVKNEKFLDSIGSQEQYIIAKLNMMGRLREEGRASSPVIKSIAKQSSVKLISFSNRYWYINYEDTFGFLSDIYFVETEEMKSFKEALIKQNKELELKKNREAYQKEMAQRRAHIDSIDNARQMAIEEAEKEAELQKKIKEEEEKKQKILWASEQKEKERLRKIEYEEEKRLKKLEEEKEEKRLKKLEEERRADIISKYGNDIGNKLINGEYWLKMTSEMAKVSLGEPSQIRKSVGHWGINETWLYPSYLILEFENGILKSYTE